MRTFSNLIKKYISSKYLMHVRTKNSLKNGMSHLQEYKLSTTIIIFLQHSLIKKCLEDQYNQH